MKPDTDPLVTIIITTFNSESMLPRVFDGLRRQTMPLDKIEILLVDGGSKDKTREWGEAHGCRVINNPRTEPVNAKYLGYLAARGKFAIYLDHDEVPESATSIAKKVALMETYPGIQAVVGSGYKNPAGYPFINRYINEFGEPFSFFAYRLSKDANFFVRTMKRRYGVKSESVEGVLIDLTSASDLPIIELCAAGCMINLQFFRRELAHAIRSAADIPHLFYILLERSKIIAITKDDALIHYSSDTVAKYLKKIKWRVKNNVFHVKTMGEAGFQGRARYGSKWLQLKKLLFLPYCASLILPLADAIWLCASRRSLLYINHVWLSLYTAWLIVFYMSLRSFGYHPRLRSYDESRVVGD